MANSFSTDGVAAMYLALVVERAMIGCFFELQETAVPLRMNVNPEIECQ